MMLEIFDQIMNRIRLVVGRCVLMATNYDGKDLFADAELLAGERRRGLDFAQHYGFSSRPKGNVSGIALFIGGSRDNGVVIATHGDGSEMAQALNPGEVCVHSPFGSKILLDESGNIVISVASGKKVVCKADTFSISGDLVVDGEITTNKAGLPVTLSGHIHSTGVGPSSNPTPGN